MAEDQPKLSVVHYPHPALRFKAVPVAEINSDLHQIVAQMFELMYANKGIGLAATQVALPYRLFVLNLTGDPAAKDEEAVFINPEILKRKGTAEDEEGCLSLPGLYADVKRSSQVVIEAFDLKGECFEYSLSDLAARAVQHEHDHLDGVLFIDRLAEPLRRNAEPMLNDFVAAHKRHQTEGTLASDEMLRQQLSRLATGAPRLA